MSDYRIRPKARLRKEIEAHGSINAAARKFGIEPLTLSRFLNCADVGISGQTIAAIIERTGLDYDQLFEHEEQD